MDRTKAWNRMWLLGAAPLAVASIVGGGIVFAGSDNPVSNTISAITLQQAPTTANDYITGLAGNLGVSEQSLRDAIQKTDLSFLDKAVADGKLTQEKADQIRARIQSGEKAFAGLHGFERGGKGGPGGHGGPGGAGMHAGGADLAAFLGITEDEVRTEMTSGKTLAQVAEAHGKTRDQLKAFLTAEQKEHLAEAVAAGKLTQAQADAKLAEMTANLDSMIDATKPAGVPGDHGGRMAPGSMAPGSMAPGRMAPGGAARSTPGQN